ncbi:MAG TPA: DoxX family protein [Bacteroidia bacterium]|jgi:putative oxidoreductase|nr:DoxX family protein [Bacteroidia bacterium]
MNTTHYHIAAEAVTRIFLGILFFAQGYDKVFNLGIPQVIGNFEYPVRLRHLPRFPLVLAAYFTSLAELICGFLLIIGFMKYYALYLLGLDLLIVGASLSMLEPLWDMKHVFPRLLLLLILLVLPSEWGTLSVDYAWSVIRFIRHILHS